MDLPAGGAARCREPLTHRSRSSLGLGGPADARSGWHPQSCFLLSLRDYVVASTRVMVRMMQPPSSGQSLTRFGRRVTEGSDLPAQVDKATEEFRNSLEREVQTVLEAAAERAAELEREAARQATKAKRESEAKAQQMLEATFARVSRLLDSIALVENALSGMLDGLRVELADMAPPTLSKGASESGAPAEALAVEGRASAKRPDATPVRREPQREETPRPAEETKTDEVQRASAEGQQKEQREVQRASATGQEKEQRAGGDRRPIAPPAGTSNAPQEPDDERPASQVSSNQEGQPPHGPDTTGESDQMVQAQVRRLFHQGISAQVTRMVREGKSRAEVERFLSDIRGGERFLGILDQFYPERSPDKDQAGRGFLRRLRRRGRRAASS